MLPEIGSNYWLNPKEDYNKSSRIPLEDFGYYGDDSVFLSSGRSCENYVLDDIEYRNGNINKVALVPPFTCHTVLEPFYKRKYKICTYNISLNLRTSPEDLKRIIEKEKPGVVLIHRYFGFDTFGDVNDIIHHYSSQGVVFIEDVTQSFFSSFEPIFADYYIGSLRKWAGLPDGGLAIVRNGNFRKKPSMYDVELTDVKLAASFAKYQYLKEHIGNKQHYLELYSNAERILSEEKLYYRISPISESVFSKLDLNELIQRRRNNYSYLFERLENESRLNPIMGQLHSNEVPLYFPIYTSDRKSFQLGLSDENIYAPIVWPLPDTSPTICSEASELYEHLICIPIDQRYDLDDMMRIAECIERLLK